MRIGQPILALLLALLSGCYTVENDEMFPVQRAALGTPELAAFSREGASVERLPIEGGPSIETYLIRVPTARGTIVFFGGNGNELTPVIKVVLPHLRQLHLNFLLLNYWPTDQIRPDPAAVMAATALIVATAKSVSPGPVCLMGHSLGSWFALSGANRRDVSGVVLAAVGTVPRELTVAQAGVWRPLLWHSAQAKSLEPLDGVSLAAKSVTPTLVVTSDADQEIPSRMSVEVFEALPPRIKKELLVLPGVSHSGYLRSLEFWDAAARYLCELPN